MVITFSSGFFSAVSVGITPADMYAAALTACPILPSVPARIGQAIAAAAIMTDFIFPIFFAPVLMIFTIIFGGIT